MPDTTHVKFEVDLWALEDDLPGALAWIMNLAEHTAASARKDQVFEVLDDFVLDCHVDGVQVNPFDPES